MTTAAQIFNYIQGMNPSTQTVSSLGTFVTEMSQQVADNCISEVVQVLVNSDKTETLAFNIIKSATRFTEKQLWVIAFELEKNAEFSSMVVAHYNEMKAKSDQKAAESKAKLAANKEASSDVLAPIKAAKKIGEFGKWLNTSGNPFRKQHFSKKYTQEAVNSFLSI